MLVVLHQFLQLALDCIYLLLWKMKVLPHFLGNELGVVLFHVVLKVYLILLFAKLEFNKELHFFIYRLGSSFAFLLAGLWINNLRLVALSLAFQCKNLFRAVFNQCVVELVLLALGFRKHSL